MDYVLTGQERASNGVRASLDDRLKEDCRMKPKISDWGPKYQSSGAKWEWQQAGRAEGEGMGAGGQGKV